MKAFMGVALTTLLMAVLLWFAFIPLNTSPKITNTEFNNKNPKEIRCSDFHTHQDAQDFFDSKGEKKGLYTHLDKDGDGLVCEGL